VLLRRDTKFLRNAEMDYLARRSSSLWYKKGAAVETGTRPSMSAATASSSALAPTCSSDAPFHELRSVSP
jgi:hypothetical protein